MRVGRGPAPGLARLLDGGAHLLERELGGAGLHPRASSRPPVAMSLITSAPALSCSRTALRASSGPSASRPSQYPWPPVMQIGRAGGEDARPVDGPSLDDRAPHRDLHVLAAAEVPHRGHARPRTVSRARSSALDGGERQRAPRGAGAPDRPPRPRQRCTWQLMRPGRSVWPARSTRSPRGARASSTTAVMRPSSTTTARPRTGSAPVPSMMRAAPHEDERPGPPGQTLSRGSSVSRRPSPKRLMPSTVMRIARPGNVASHHAVER